VWPRLQLSRANDRHLVVANRGTGPARVRAVRVEVDGRAVKAWADLMRAFGHQWEPGSKPYGVSTIGQGVVIPAGQEVEAFSAHDDDAGRALFKDVMRDKIDKKRIGILICYCSVLDQCWLAGTGDADPDQEIDECPVAERDRFTD
jgi:hypothetical protein